MWKFILAQTIEKAEPADIETAVEVVEGVSEGAPPATTPQGGLMNMLPMIALFVAFIYFFMIRPQKKQEQQRRDMLGALKKGDAVVTSGGICGTVVGLSESSVVLKVDDNVTMEFVRGAVSQVRTEED